MHDDTAPYALSVDIVSDVVCPWCIIGYRQFARALASLPFAVNLDLRWHPFELNPDLPEGGENLRDHLARKMGSNPEQSRAIRARLAELGTALGFRFNFSDAMRVVNTHRAHQLLHWAGLQGQQTEVKLALFAAYFTHQEDVSDVAVLARIAAGAGLAGEEATAVLQDARYAALVREEELAWREREIHAVPTFILNGSYQVAGAQEAETFARIVTRMRERHAA